MKVVYDPSLMQEVVFQEMTRREKDGDLRLYREYHELADSIYEEFSIEQREEEFEKLSDRLFLQLGFGAVIDKALAEFPGLEIKVEAVVVGKTIIERDEGADLSKDLKCVGIKIPAERFLALPDLRRRLRHELMHVSDMLDNHFGYEYRAKLNVSSAGEENLIKDRYSLFWDIYIESRLSRENKESVSDKDGRFREFAILYRKLPPAQQTVLFESIWKMEKLTHDQILEMAGDTAKLLQRFDIQLDIEGVLEQEKILLPGSPCPLCRFPTYNWDEGSGRVEENIIKRITEDYPDWKAGDGVCERCIEGYQAIEKETIK